MHDPMLPLIGDQQRYAVVDNVGMATQYTNSGHAQYITRQNVRLPGDFLSG